MHKQNIGLTMFPILIPRVAVNHDTFESENEMEASPFYIRRVTMDRISKKLIAQITQAETGAESELEIPPGENQALVFKALELAQVTHTPVLLAVDNEQTVNFKKAA